MTNNNVYGVSRRLLLKVAGSAGFTAIGQANAHPFRRTDDANPATDPESPSKTAAIEWLTGALWRQTGLSTEFPGQVVFPKYSHIALKAIQAIDSRIALEDGPARAAARLQDQSSGGFFRQHGDFLGPWTTATYHALALARQSAVSVDETAAVEFLLDHQTDAGGFAPRSGFAGGSIVSTLEATHKSIVALTEQDAVSQSVREQVLTFLNDTQHSTGGWPSVRRQDAPTVEGTYHAVITLSVLGELTPATTRAVTRFLRTVQRPAGGFRNTLESVDCSSLICRFDPAATTRSTAQALVTLSWLDRLSRFSEDVHADWLADRQLQNPTDERLYGGFETAPDRSPAVTNYLPNTAFAAIALDAVGALGRIDRSATEQFLTACQHPGTKGFGPWPSSLSSLVDTEAAIRALDLLDERGRVPRDALVATLANGQRDDGALTHPDRSAESTVEQTALAVLALDRLDRLDAVDHAAAATFIIDHQHERGGFTNTAGTDTTTGSPSPQTTWLAVRALAAAEKLSRIDLAGVGTYLADQQADRGHVSESSPDTMSAVCETRYALETLAHIDRFDDIDRKQAIAYLRSRQQEDEYTNRAEARHVVAGLAVAGAVDSIDHQSTRRLLGARQTTAGGFADREFYTGETAMQRHAGTIEALTLLDGFTEPS